MTAVVNLSINNYPLLIGDLLLSAPESVGAKVSMPTVDDLSKVFPEGSGFIPSGLCQKVAVIGENLAIGWAGSRIAASSVIKELIEKNQEELLTYESVKTFFMSVDESIRRQGVGFLGLIKDSYGIRQFGLNCRNFRTALYGDVGLLGSGADRIEEYLKSLSLLPHPAETAGNNFTRSVLTALGLTGSLLSWEIGSPSSLYEFFGAGYEIIYLLGGKFKKIDDITYLFWIAQTDGEHVSICFPHRSLKISYLGDVLVVRVDTIDHAGGSIKIPETSCHFVSPVYRRVAQQELDGFVPPSMNSRFMCNYFMFQDSKRKPTILTAANYVGQEEPSIKFIEEEWKAKQFAVKDSYLEEIVERIRERFQA